MAIMSICIRAGILRKTRAIAACYTAAAGLIALAMASSGCVYRMAVQQGNFLDPVQVQQLQTGMTRAQVRFLLGTPMLPDAFKRDRWDYIYYLKQGSIKRPIERRLTVWFEGEKVARFENVGIELPRASTTTIAGAPSAPSAENPASAASAAAAPAPAAPPSGP